MENLTAKEEEIMQILWDLKKALVRDIMNELPNSKQPYTTISSIVRILERKGFVSHKPYGKTHEYYPLVSRDRYFKEHFKILIKNYFSNSPHRFVSFFTEKANLDLTELEEMKNIIEEQIRKKRAKAS